MKPIFRFRWPGNGRSIRFLGPVMKTFYGIARLTGYLAGGIGVIVLVLGRRSTEPRGALFVAGAALVIISFAAFFASYVLYIFQRLSRR